MATPKANYADLRVKGQIVLGVQERHQVTTLRRYAAKDGLKIVQYTRPHRRREGFLRREQPLTVALVHPDNPTTLVRPDAPTVCAGCFREITQRSDHAPGCPTGQNGSPNYE